MAGKKFYVPGILSIIESVAATTGSQKLVGGGVYGKPLKTVAGKHF